MSLWDILYFPFLPPFLPVSFLPSFLLSLSFPSFVLLSLQLPPLYHFCFFFFFLWDSLLHNPGWKQTRDSSVCTSKILSTTHIDHIIVYFQVWHGLLAKRAFFSHFLLLMVSVFTSLDTFRVSSMNSSIYVLKPSSPCIQE